ncbi:hypothetical protein FMEAI12_6600001 [Parafrankia sp. Ea1.12]|nr:hypothetical protein FMEAI12_6600001 [Parafrankia sp. Ea1.12]
MAGHKHTTVDTARTAGHTRVGLVAGYERPAANAARITGHPHRALRNQAPPAETASHRHAFTHGAGAGLPNLRATANGTGAGHAHLRTATDGTATNSTGAGHRHHVPPGRDVVGA